MIALIIILSCLPAFKMGKRNLGGISMCEVCGKTRKDFSSRKYFFLHLQSTSHTKNNLNCDQCDKMFQFKRGLDDHKSEIHGEISFRVLDKGVSGTVLDPKYSILLDNFCSSVNNLHKEFELSLTPKFHIIESHLKFYF